jgi:glucokinase
VSDAPPPPARRRDVILAVDLGGTKFEVGLVTLRGDVLDRSRVEVDRDLGARSLFAGLAEILGEQIVRAREQHDVRIRAVGVGSAGPIARQVEHVSPINIPAWREYPLRAELQTVLATHGLRVPVYGDLDAKALALAEGWLGAARGVEHFCAITVSTGVGGGIVLDGLLLDGASGNAGHVGHVIVEPGGRRCGCGARGCLEAEASGTAIEAITGRPPTEPSYEIMQRTGRLVGRAAATVCTALDLDLVVVGGSVAFGFAATFFNSAAEELDRCMPRTQGRSPRIVSARLGDRAALVGAGAVGVRGLRRQAAARAAERTAAG